MNNFDDLLMRIKSRELKKIAVAVAQDEEVLEALRDAKEYGLADSILVGNKKEIALIADNIGMDLAGFEIMDEHDQQKAALTAVELVSSGRADMLMKGIIDTASLLRAVLDKGVGIRTGSLISHVGVFEIPGFDRLILITDGGFNMYPDLKEKIQITENAVKVAHALGVQLPKVAPVCAVEVVNPDMPSTVDASMLSKMNDRGQITGCVIDGPLALDNAISIEAVKRKKISGPVAGLADIVLVPNFEVGNVIYKTLMCTTKAKIGGILVGSSAPVIVTSRADEHEAKLNSIALAALLTETKVN